MKNKNEKSCEGWVFIRGDNVHMKVPSGGTKAVANMEKDDWCEESINEGGAAMLVMVGLIKKTVKRGSPNVLSHMREFKLDSGVSKDIGKMEKDDWSEKTLYELGWRLQEAAIVLAGAIRESRESFH